jgi:carbonic anhydrase
MQKLVKGIHEFQRDVFRSEREMFERLAKGQSPETLFITCSDSRINPNLLTGTKPGELFILRNAGNLVPPFGAVRGGEAATVEYAVSILNVQDIIVCGHSHCGAMSALVEPKGLDEVPAVKEWLGYAESTRRVVQTNYASLDVKARANVAIPENVLTQIENLRTHPSVAARLARGDLGLHGWVYKIETGEVFAYETETGQFSPVLESMKPAMTRSSTPGVAIRAI